MEDDTYKINQVLWWGINKLRVANIETAQLDAELLLARSINVSREFLYRNHESEIDENQYFVFEKLIAQRLMRVPVAYLLQEKYFFDQKLHVDSNVLIPRPESEELVFLSLERIIKIIESGEIASILEIGTGSGAIIIAIADTLRKRGIKEKVNIFASDKSRNALEITRKNLEDNQLDQEIELFESDLLLNIPEKVKPDIIVANLPYLDINNIDEYSPEIKYEPHVALFADDKGLKLYKDLFKQIKEKKYNNPTVIIECLEEQKESLQSLYKNLLVVEV